MDKIFVEGLALRGKHGVHHREKQEDQDFILDISAEFDSRAGAVSDKLADTIDYRRFCDIARDVVEDESFDLIERLADTIGKRILEDSRIGSVVVSIRKPQAFKNGIPGVTIIRTR
jgi:7,8-dihydroneopterin aldolase/epimerase/oxygenase